ncbi:MAG: host attachment protein [Polyangiaceae bacterium]|nr:host attachment protein [Polyangiaceae bacterium]
MPNRSTARTWILVCDASRAHLFLEEPRKRSYTLLESFSHEESRARVRDLMADAQGRKPSGNTSGIAHGGAPGGATNGNYLGRPGAAPDTDPKHVEAQKFVRELADALERGLHDHSYDSLVLIAPPQFLGLLRGAVSAQVEKRIEGTVDKNFSWLEQNALVARLRELRGQAA